MKLSLANVVMFSAGVILIYSGIKAYNPKDVILWGLGGREPFPFTEEPPGKIGKFGPKKPSIVKPPAKPTDDNLVEI